MKRASYRDAIDYIACNDEPTEMNPEDVNGFATVQLVSQIFDVPSEKVAADIVKLRKKTEDTTQPTPWAEQSERWRTRS